MTNNFANLVKSYAKVSAMGNKPFYASDLGLNGGSIGGLECYHVIKKTGKSKFCWIQITETEKIRVEVYEWRFNKNNDFKRFNYFKEFERQFEEMKEAKETYDTMKAKGII